jgi:hypothetical protein
MFDRLDAWLAPQKPVDTALPLSPGSLPGIFFMILKVISKHLLR